MKIHISKPLFEKAVAEIKKPHDFAFERVGYFIGSTHSNLIIFDEWFSFEDSYYEKNNDVGARIGAAGMKYLMTKALATNKSFLQFHLHDFPEKPNFSYVDLNSIKEIIPSLFNFSPEGPHGALVGNDFFVTSIMWFQQYGIQRKCTFEIANLWENK